MARGTVAGSPAVPSIETVSGGQGVRQALQSQGSGTVDESMIDGEDSSRTGLGSLFRFGVEKWRDCRIGL
jgi:hypothetical protein